MLHPLSPSPSLSLPASRSESFVHDISCTKTFLLLLLLLLLPSSRSTVVHTFYAGVARSRSGFSSFTASALNKLSSSSSSSSSRAVALGVLLLLLLLLLVHSVSYEYTFLLF